MSATAVLPNHLRPRREKVFGAAPGIPLDRNAKVRIMVYAQGYNARYRSKGQHRGPITRAFMEVLEALLWGFHNCGDGRCFPSYESIAARAKCNRDTVYEAIKALEFANVLSWVNRITRIRTRERDLFGQWATRWRIIRTSNAYLLRDPLPCHEGRPTLRISSKSENPSGTIIQEFTLSSQAPTPPDPTIQLAAQKALAHIRQQRESILHGTR
jgi:Helix-turn-helix domain